MKILCPIDFSEVSVSAVRWAADALSHLDAVQIDLCHFIYFKRRATMFLSVDQLFLDRAKTDMSELITSLKTAHPDITFTESIYQSHPKDGVISIIKKGDYDLVVTGTNGLHALKDMTVGSMTEYVFDHSEVPVLAVPGSATKGRVRKIALAVDDKQLKKMAPVSFLKELSKTLGAEIHLVHVTMEGESPFEYDPAIDMIFRHTKFEYHRLKLDQSLTQTINRFCTNANIDLLSMIHHRHSWLNRLFKKSTAKKELFEFKIPLLVLNDKIS